VSKHLEGISASPGIAIGPGWVYRPVEVDIKRLENQTPDEEVSRLEEALNTAKNQLEILHQKTLDEIGTEEAAIFEAHKMFLDDPELINSIQNLIKDQRINAEAAVNEIVERYAAEMEALKDEYFQARAQDIRDVGRRIVCCLAGVEMHSVALPGEPVIISADDLTPSDTVQFDREKILGLCTRRGGPTSHTAILARSLGVPAAVSVPFEFDDVLSCENMILDGMLGELVINPSEDELRTAKDKMKVWQSEWQVQLSSADQPATTLDGINVEVVANIGNLEDAKQALEYGAEGVGLLRTEFLYMDRQSMPNEMEQVQAYKDIFEVMGDRPLVVRTLDIGGDKEVDYLGLSDEPNPFLGWRAIRMISERPEILQRQMRALLQAGVNCDLRIMIPLVSNIEEVIQARKFLDGSLKSLQQEGLPHAENVQFGIMVEVPSAALLVEHISKHVDFFSIGTNDLTQYTLAVDRTNERVADLASPFHPAVLKLIAMTIQYAHGNGKWVGLCGEMAGDPTATAFLLGVGLDEFSMAPTSIPVVKQVIRGLEKKHCSQIAAQALELPSTIEVKDFLKSVLN
jgi:phosphoenolpyruvate-protein phosphotransferase